MLQLATMRTNSEGAWWLIWNFIAKDVQTGDVVIPTEAQDVTPTDVVEIDDLNLAETLFQQDIDGVTASLSSVTYNIADVPYGFYWWNGGSAAWEASSEDDYGKKVWYPTATPVEDFALILTKKSDGTYAFEEEVSGNKGTFAINGNTLKFSAPVTFFSDGGDEFTTDELIVTKANATDNVFNFSVVNETNSANQVTKYKYVNLTQKSVGGGGITGPVEVKVDQSKVTWNYGDTDGKAVRITLYNAWTGLTDAVDISKMKLKKGKTLKVTFKITSGITWNADAEPLAMLRHNVEGLGIGSSWDSFTEGDVVKVNKDGETTISLTNNTGTTADFSSGSVQIVLQIDSKYTKAHDLCEITIEDEQPVITGEVKITIE